MAVLFIFFNRISEAKQVFYRIREQKPEKLFIAADGPRDRVEGEKEKCDYIRKWVVAHIDWDCEVHKLFRDTNAGCGKAVSEAITWFFDNVSEGIILEDDCLPGNSFFPFCTELLEKYRHEEHVSIISGNNFQPRQPMGLPSDYYFSVFPSTWGWATWKRTWQGYQLHMDTWGQADKKALLRFLFRESKYRNWWEKQFDDFYTHRLEHTWDFQFYYHCMARRQLAVIPQANLVTNIGGGVDATHFKNSESSLLHIPAVELGGPIHHPRDRMRNYEADVYIQDLLFGQLERDGPVKKVKRMIKRVIRYKTEE